MCIREKHLFHNDISPHLKFLLSNEKLDFLEFLNKRSKGLTVQIHFHSLFIIFTVGADIFAMTVYIHILMFGSDFFFIEINTFINQGCIKLSKSESKDIY